MPKSRSQRLLFAVVVVVLTGIIGRNLYHHYCNRALMAAVLDRDLPATQSLVARGADVNQVQRQTGLKDRSMLAMVMEYLHVYTPVEEALFKVRGTGVVIAGKPTHPDGSEAIACLLIDRGAYPGAQKDAADTDYYLYYACRGGSLKITRRLLDKGADPNAHRGTAIDAALDYRNSSPALPSGTSADVIALHTAQCKERTLQMVRLLREHGAKLTPEQIAQLGDPTELEAAFLRDRSPAAQRAVATEALYQAVARKNLSEMQHWLARGADPNNRNPAHGNTALEMALYGGNIDIIKLLLAHGAKLEGNKAASSLQTALWQKRADLLRLLLAHGATSETLLSDAINRMPEFVPELLQHSVDINAPQGLPLRTALATRRFAIVDELLRRGASVNYPSSASLPRKRPQWPDAQINSSYGAVSSPIASVSLPTKRVDPVPQPPKLQILPFSPLMTAVGFAPEYEARLRKMGAVIGPDKATILVDAARGGRLDLFTRLLAYGADVNGSDVDEETALTQAIVSAPAGVPTLLEHGANTNVVTTLQRTPLSMAAGRGDVSLTRLLLARGAQVNLRPPRGHTALYWAQNHHHAEVVTLLRQAGATGE